MPELLKQAKTADFKTIIIRDLESLKMSNSKKRCRNCKKYSSSDKVLHINGATFRPENGDFIASRQQLGSVVVWNINGLMCVVLEDDPVYITKEQAMKFFNLVEAPKK